MESPHAKCARALVLLLLLAVEPAVAWAQNNSPTGSTPIPRPPVPHLPRGIARRDENERARGEPTWELWWTCNKEDYLLPRAVLSPDVTGDQYTGTLGPPIEQEIRASVIPILLQALQEGEHDVRAAAAIALGKAGDWREIKTLIATVNDRDRTVAEAAILALGLLGESAVEHTLREVMNESTRTIRERGLAAIALGYSGGDVARAALFDQLGATSDAEGRGRAPAIEGDRFIGAALWAGADKKGGTASDRSPLAASLIQRALGSSNVKDRVILGLGSGALAKTRDQGSLQFLLRGLGDSRADVRTGSAIAAGRVIKAEDRRSVQTLIAALATEGEPMPKRMMLISLGRIGGPDARKRLIAELDAGTRQDRSFAAVALGVSGATDLAPRLRKEFEGASDDSLKGATAIALGIMRDPEALKLVAEVAKAKNNPELVRHLMYFLALDRGRGTAAIAEQVANDAKVGEVHDVACLAMGLIGSEDSQALLVKHLTSTGPVTLRRGAAIGLARMGDRRSITPLLKVARNGNEQQILRAGAITALGILCQRNPYPPFARVSIDSSFDLENEAVDLLRDLL